MNTRFRAGALALTAALALGACTKAPAVTTEANGQSGSTATEQTTVTDPSTTATDAPNTTDTEAPAPKGQTMNVQLKVAKADIKADADAKSKTLMTLDQKNKMGSKTTLLVLDTKGDFIHVALPIRPNGSTGWIDSKNVDVRVNDMKIKVDLAAHKASVLKNDAVVIETPVAIGTDQNKTPKGNFFVTDLVQTDNAGGAYGPFALGLSAHSDTLTEFGGGDGQVALHGTNDPSSIGKSVSHGCVRLPNDTITKVANMTPLGTPVEIA